MIGASFTSTSSGTNPTTTGQGGNRDSASGGSNPGLQLANPFRHAGWQAPIGAPALAGQRLDRLARLRRQPSRRLRPARLPPGGHAPGFATEPQAVRPTLGNTPQRTIKFHDPSIRTGTRSFSLRTLPINTTSWPSLVSTRRGERGTAELASTGPRQTEGRRVLSSAVRGIHRPSVASTTNTHAASKPHPALPRRSRLGSFRPTP